MLELDHKESWVPKNWCFWTVVLEKTLESPLDCKEIQPVHPKGNQPWISIGRTDAEAEAPIRWPPDANNWLTGKDPDAGKDWRQEEKGTTEDKMIGWHHQLEGHEFEQALGVGEGQGSLACCPRGHKELDTTERLNWKPTVNTSLCNTMGRFFKNNVKNFPPNLDWCQTPFTNIEINKDDALPYLFSLSIMCYYLNFFVMEEHDKLQAPITWVIF